MPECGCGLCTVYIRDKAKRKYVENFNEKTIVDD